MNSKSVQSAQAAVAALEGVYDQNTPEMNPDGDPLFRVAFRLEDGSVKIFWINSYDYYALKVGMEGLLRWQGDQLLSFGNWIHQTFNLQTGQA